MTELDRGPVACQERILKPCEVLASLGDGDLVIQVVTWPFTLDLCVVQHTHAQKKTTVSELSIKT